jgi:ABC-type molybdate transport system substrate-binding protein
MFNRPTTVVAISAMAIGTLLFPIALPAGAVANAAEIKVLSAFGAKLIVDELIPQFERATNNKVTISYGQAGAMRKRILDGEAFDLTILPSGWEEVRGKIANDPVGIVHADFGMAVIHPH